MQTVTEIALENARRGIFTRLEVACWLGKEVASLDALLKRAVAAGEILRIRRGLFCLAGKYRKTALHAFDLAQRILGPSYISLESALAHHGWIPEAVYTITSVSLQRARRFDTPVGYFSYTCVPQDRLFAGVDRKEVGDAGCCFVASPLKALADYVYVHRHDWRGLSPVTESLRVEYSELGRLTVESFDALIGVYRSERVCRFLDAVRKELKL